jgi:hypothetical protein
MTCHICANETCLGECEPKLSEVLDRALLKSSKVVHQPMAWKHYTKPLERRLEHLETKEHQNSFDKHEASALRHVLGIVSQPQRQWVGLTDEEHMILYTKADSGLHEWAKAIEAKLKEKNT